MKTESIKSNEIVRDWYIVDAKDKTLGRLASSIAQILRGKNKVNFSPNLDMSDFIIVINAEKVILTGNKKNTKEYWRHTGYPGGQKTVSYKKMLDEKPDQIIRTAVKGMLPHNKLGRKLLNHLKVYSGTVHPHKAQSPKELSIN
ncbi:MAG: 50S ribosomal protein L13 [Candidatus Marinimicrobia bacterium]|nr:50S ribosomal protein L13 [Candidatus Neomarinimicrobiota bacterium]|tara:strand:- start:1191 stop:1622 length:432 start_codon:yes stop_codon:yes gene_type:complete